MIPLKINNYNHMNKNTNKNFMEKYSRFYQLIFLPLAISILISCQMKTDTSSVYIDDLRCEYQDQPLAIDVDAPRLSWKMKVFGVRGEIQTAYQIIVASSPDNLKEGKADLWDTGKIVSDKSTQVTYKGKSLSSQMQCYWKVKIWNKDGKPSEWSKTGMWTMGLLDVKDWQAKWISSPKEDKSPWYRHQFNIRKKPEQATIYVASLGYFELFINGKKVGNEVLAPAVSNYNKRSYYQTFDVSSYLTKGENCIGIWMGQGWYKPGLPGVLHFSPVIRAQLNMNMDGQEMLIKTDTSWLTHSSSRTLLGSWSWGNFGGELLDARKAKPNWNLANISTIDWENTVEVKVADVPCVAQSCPANRQLNPIMPESIELLDTNKILVDFGTNLTGLMDIKFRNLKSGEKIVMYYADMDARGKDFYEHPQFLKDEFSILGQWDEFISAGDADEEFRNVFNYHAFRYAIIEGLSYLPEKKDIVAIPVESDLDEVGSFSCSNDLFNRINKMVVWTYRCLDLGGQTVDCPHRERLGYGDGQTIMDLGCFNFYAPALYSKWSQNWWDEQREDGSVPFTAPSPHPTGGGPAWGAMCIVVPWKTHLFYNDTLLLKQGYPYMKRYIDFLTANSDKGLFKDIYSDKYHNLGDWVPPARGMEKRDWGDTDSRLLFNNCYRVYLLEIMQKVSTILEKNDDATEFQEEIKISREIIHKTYYNPEKGIYANGEQPYLIFPLKIGVTPDELKDEVFDKYIETMLVNDSGHVNTGMMATQQVIDYLMEVDRNDLISTFVDKTTFPGWGYMLECGATTCTEQWNGYYSQIHSCFPYIGGWFYRGLAGINWDEDAPGFKNVILRPGIVKSVDWVKCSYQSPYGEIASNWKVEGNVFAWEVTIPPNSTATVYIPGSDIKENGIILEESENITFMNGEKNYTVFKVKSGQYFFKSNITQIEN